MCFQTWLDFCNMSGFFWLIHPIRPRRDSCNAILPLKRVIRHGNSYEPTNQRIGHPSGNLKLHWSNGCVQLAPRRAGAAECQVHLATSRELRQQTAFHGVTISSKHIRVEWYSRYNPFPRTALIPLRLNDQVPVER